MGQGREAGKERGGASTLSAWAQNSICVAWVATVAAVGLALAALRWGLVADRIGGLVPPLGALVVAALASAGAARTVMAQSDIAERNRREDIEAAMWKRYDEAAKQLGSDQGFAVRSAGVYALAGLANDWIRHHERTDELAKTERDKANEADTVVSLLCAHLRMRSQEAPGLSDAQIRQEEFVNEAIISRLQVEFQRGTTLHGARGMWAGRIVIDLRGADLNKSRLAGVDFTRAVLKDADLHDADFTDAILDDADLSRAKVSQAHFTRSSMNRTVVDAVESDNHTRWPEDFVCEDDEAGVSRMVHRPEK